MRSPMTTEAIPRTLSPTVLAVGDAAVLVLWSVLGLMRHAEGITAAGLARNSGFVLVGWFVVAPLAGTYRRPGLRTMLITWAAGVTLGVVLRWIVLRRPVAGAELVFVGVTLVVTLSLVLAWRVTAWSVVRLRHAPREHRAGGGTSGQGSRSDATREA